MMIRRTSVRLDARSRRALDELVANGRTKSQAIRDALRIAAEESAAARTGQPIRRGDNSFADVPKTPI